MDKKFIIITGEGAISDKSLADSELIQAVQRSVHFLSNSKFNYIAIVDVETEDLVGLHVPKDVPQPRNGSYLFSH